MPVLEESEQLDLAFHALANATRRGIVDQLSRSPASVSELAEPFDMSLAAIHQHIQVLVEGGLVITEKRGRTRECRLSRDAVKRVEQWLNERRQLWESRFDRLGALLEGDDINDPPGPSTPTVPGDES